MYFKLKISLTILLASCLSFKVSAVEPIQPKKINVIQAGDRHRLQTNWGVTFDIKAIKENGLLGFIENYHLYVGSNTKLKFKNIPDEIDKLRVYGNTLKNKGGIYVHLWGDFEGVSAENLVYNQLFKNLEDPQLEKQKSYRNHRIPVLVYKVIGDDSNNKIYATKINNQFIVVSNRPIKDKFKSVRKSSLDKNTRKFMRKYERNSKKITMNNEGLLVSLKINLESLRKKLEEDSFLLQSAVFNNTKNIVFKVQKDQSRIYFASALGTKNKETAVQINKVIVGIVENSIQNSQNIDSIKSMLINNLNTTIEDNRVILNTSIPLPHKDQ